VCTHTYTSIHTHTRTHTYITYTYRYTHSQGYANQGKSRESPTIPSICSSIDRNPPPPPESISGRCWVEIGVGGEKVTLRLERRSSYARRPKLDEKVQMSSDVFAKSKTPRAASVV